MGTVNSLGGAGGPSVARDSVAMSESETAVSVVEFSVGRLMSKHTSIP